MPYGDIAEGILRIAGRAFIQFFVEVIFDVVCFDVGKPIVRVVTFGRYPSARPSATQEIVISTVGMLALLAVVLAIGTRWLFGWEAPYSLFNPSSAATLYASANVG
jgi:hypothetical protein